MANPIVFFDMTIGGVPAGRIEFELYADTCPKTAENFRAFCTGEKGIGRFGYPLHYKGTIIDRVFPHYGCIGGGMIAKAKYQGEESIYGGKVKGEFSGKKNDRPGMLSLNPADNGNASTFFYITTKASYVLESNYVIGHVVNGLDVVKAIESIIPDANSKPTKPVIIADCGQIINELIFPQNINTDTEVYFDIEIGGIPSGRIVMKLFYDTTPITAANFRSLCTGETEIGKTSGKALHFKGSTFHRVIPGVMCHGGDFSLKDGSGGESIHGDDIFLSESFVNKHTGPGILSMVNTANGANGSQFYICTAKTDWLDGKHVVFGQVVQGMDVVKAIENVGSADGMTTKSVKISDCGEINFDYREETSADKDEDIEPY